MVAKSQACEILVATFGHEGLLRALRNLPEVIPESVLITIGVQRCAAIPEQCAGQVPERGVRILFYDAEHGLSRNRNRLLDTACGKVCVIADDDNRYSGEALRRIVDLRKNSMGGSVYLFKVKVKGQVDGLRRTYPPEGHAYSIREVLLASSHEIVFNRSDLEGVGVRFDERFGINARFCFGEELLFLQSVLEAGLRVVQIDEVLCETEPSDVDRLKTRITCWDAVTLGALSYKKWGWLSVMLCFREAVRLRTQRVAGGLKWPRFVASFLSGIFECYGSEAK